MCFFKPNRYETNIVGPWMVFWFWRASFGLKHEHDNGEFPTCWQVVLFNINMYLVFNIVSLVIDGLEISSSLGNRQSYESNPMNPCHCGRPGWQAGRRSLLGAFLLAGSEPVWVWQLRTNGTNFPDNDVVHWVFWANEKGLQIHQLM